MPIEEKILTHKVVPQKKRFTREHLLIIISLFCTVATVIILTAIVRKNAPAQHAIVGDLGKKAKVTVKKVDWKKELIDTSLFQQLKNPLPAPLDVGVVGNPKPFVE